MRVGEASRLDSWNLSCHVKAITEGWWGEWRVCFAHAYYSSPLPPGIATKCVPLKKGHAWYMTVTWLILPVVICLSQRLSHACLSINNFVLWNCEWLITTVIIYLIVFTTWITVVILELIHATTRDRVTWLVVFIRYKTNAVGVTRPVSWWVIITLRIEVASAPSMIHSNFCPINFRW